MRLSNQIQDAAKLRYQEAPRLTTGHIGRILMDNGRLTHEETERILAEQRSGRQRFGEAGIALGLLTPADIEFALSNQFAYPYLLRGQSNVSEELVAAYDPFSKEVEALRALRSQLVMRWFSTGERRSALAVTSAEPGDGRSYIAANLAVLFSQLGQRTLLIDADMRHPRQHELFGIDNRVGLSTLLAGRGSIDDVQRVTSMIDLSILPSGTMPPNPQELLSRRSFQEILADYTNEYDVILIDTPADSEYADGQLAAMRAGAAMVVARRHASHAGAVGNLVDSMKQAGVMVVGAVLNDY